MPIWLTFILHHESLLCSSYISKIIYNLMLFSVIFAQQRERDILPKYDLRKYDRAVERGGDFGRPYKNFNLGALMMLVTQPWYEERPFRRCYFNVSMESLENYYRPIHSKYPLFLLSSTKRWTRQDRVEIRRRWRSFDIQFLNIKDYFHTAPLNITFEDAKDPLSDLDYKQMLSFMFYGFTKVPQLKKYRYLLRLDDDSCFKDAINYDVFQEMLSHEAYYAFREMYVDLAKVVVGLPQFVENYMSSLPRSSNTEASWANPTLRSWRIGRVPNTTSMSFSGNFEIIDLKRYMEPDIGRFAAHVLGSHMIYHRRWTECAIRYYFAEMFWKADKVLWLCDFDYQHSDWPQGLMCDHRTADNAVIKFFDRNEFSDGV